MSLTAWILLPLVGALIGYVTNTIAVTMLFRPHRPRRLLGLTVQGLIPKRQPDLARKIGAVVGDHLVEPADLRAALERVDLRPMVQGLLDQALEEKLGELSKLPMIGAFLTPDRLAGIRDGLVEAVLRHRDTIGEHLGQALDEGFDVHRIVEEKVAGFPTERLERLVLEVARRELVAIELWGAVLGGLIGLLQVLVLELIA
ncbi:MAG: DUF445 family protein [Planctomycetota bacterium]